jgi:sulfite reductase beta subunit-like hemoprotein
LKDVLLALREYKATSLQASWLQNFQWHNLRLKYGEELLHRMSDIGLFVFPTHEEVWSHNKSKLLQLNSEHPIAKLVY